VIFPSATVAKTGNGLRIRLDFLDQADGSAGKKCYLSLGAKLLHCRTRIYGVNQGYGESAALLKDNHGKSSIIKVAEGVPTRNSFGRKTYFGLGIGRDSGRRNLYI